MTKIPLFVFALISALMMFPLQSEETQRKIDRTKVLPNMTAGIHMDGSTIFTYVDEKKRRRLTLDVYRPANGEGPADCSCGRMELIC